MKPFAAVVALAITILAITVWNCGTLSPVPSTRPLEGRSATGSSAPPLAALAGSIPAEHPVRTEAGGIPWLELQIQDLRGAPVQHCLLVTCARGAEVFVRDERMIVAQAESGLIRLAEPLPAAQYAVYGRGCLPADVSASVAAGGRHTFTLDDSAAGDMRVVDGADLPLDGIALALWRRAPSGDWAEHSVEQWPLPGGEPYAVVVAKNGIAHVDHLPAARYHVSLCDTDYALLDEDAGVTLGMPETAQRIVRVGRVVLAAVEFSPDKPRLVELVNPRSVLNEQAVPANVIMTDKYVRRWPGARVLMWNVRHVVGLPEEIQEELRWSGLTVSGNGNITLRAPSRVTEVQRIDFIDAVPTCGYVTLSVTDRNGVPVAGVDALLESLQEGVPVAKRMFQLSTDTRNEVPEGRYRLAPSRLGDVRDMVSKAPVNITVERGSEQSVQVVLWCSVVRVRLRVTYENGTVPKYVVVVLSNQSNEGHPWQRTTRSMRPDCVPLTLPAGKTSVHVIVPETAEGFATIEADGRAGTRDVDIRLKPGVTK